MSMHRKKEFFLNSATALFAILILVASPSCSRQDDLMTPEEFLELNLEFLNHQVDADKIINIATKMLASEVEDIQIYRRFILSARGYAYFIRATPEDLIAAHTDLLEAIDILPDDPINATLYHWLSQVAIKQHDFSSASSFAFASASFIEDEHKKQVMHKIAEQYELTAKAIMPVTLWDSFLDSDPDFGAGFEQRRILFKGGAAIVRQNNSSTEIFFPIFVNKLDGTDNTQYGILCRLRSENAEQTCPFKQGDIVIVSALFEKKDDSKVYLRDGEVICNISNTNQIAKQLENKVAAPMEF